MADKPSFGTILITGGPAVAPKAESPFRIAVIGDFSGRQNRGVAGASEEIATRRLLKVSRDILDEVMAKLKVQLDLPLGDDGTKVSLSFASLDDFHPDQIHDRVEQIADLYDADEKSAMMNTVLHHPDFQNLESAWRGLDWLLKGAVKGGKGEVLLIDLSLSELAADLKASDELTKTGLYKLLIEKGVRGPMGEPWAVLIGNYLFDLSKQHAELLGRLAKIAGQANAPFLTSVHPQVLDKSFALSPDAAPAWQELRQLPEAKLLGLALPRFLLRLPYGENTQPIEKFSYEEMGQPPILPEYLWGNPALGCAVLIAQAFHKQGWAFKPGAILDLENLPIHVFTVDEETQVTLGEAWLVRPQTEQLVKQGFMPFLCVKGKGAMQLLRFLSLAQPAKDQPACDLHGPWNPIGAAPTPPVAKPAVAPPPKPATPAASAPPAKAIPTPPPPAKTAAPPPPQAAPPPKPAMPAVSASAVKAPPPPKPAAAPPPPEPPAEEEMDPDLAAMLKELEGG